MGTSETEARRRPAAAPDAQRQPEQTPLPERSEPRLRDPRLRDLSFADWRAIVVRGAKESLDDNITNLAGSLAYGGFLAIPSALLVVLGAFTLVAGPSEVDTLMRHLSGIVPQSAINLLGGSLKRVSQNESGGVAMVAVGAVLALWSLSGTMGTVMWALNIAFERDETRGFVRKRLTALAMIVCAVVAFFLLFGLLVLGPQLSGWVGSALGARSAVTWIWWVAQWPVLILTLLGIFASVLYLGPNVDLPRWRFLTPGAVVAVLVWLGVSGAFAYYVSNFGSYNKTWGSLSAVIVMLMWLWLSGLALLFGAEINSEAERSRELRRGEPAEDDIRAPTRA